MRRSNEFIELTIIFCDFSISYSSELALMRDCSGFLFLICLINRQIIMFIDLIIISCYVIFLECKWSEKRRIRIRDISLYGLNSPIMSSKVSSRSLWFNHRVKRLAAVHFVNFPVWFLTKYGMLKILDIHCWIWKKNYASDCHRILFIYLFRITAYKSVTNNCWKSGRFTHVRKTKCSDISRSP